LRIEWAPHLLFITGQNVDQIAPAVGYVNAMHAVAWIGLR
jgi:transcriptional regulator GlxA family with amidase domain